MTGRLPPPSAGCEHVQIEAVLTHRLLPIEGEDFRDGTVWILRRSIAYLKAITDAAPRRDLGRWHEAIRARR
jgi:hypothetical protein